MKKIFFLLLGITISIHSTYASENIAFTQHTQRINEICKRYETKASVKMQTYDEVTSGNGIDNAKKTYRTNMTNIYKCAILETQIKSLKLIKNDLIKDNADLKKDIAPKIDAQITKIGENKQKLKCTPSSANNKDPINKLAILNETSAEMCRYISYLEYLKDYNSDYANLLAQEQKDQVNAGSGKSAQKTQSIADSTSISPTSYNLSYVVALEKQKKTEIDEEIAHTYKIFPIAFDMYNQYENNITIHLLLELIKQDYVVYRQKLHKTLNPINQVVYKIANAMKK